MHDSETKYVVGAKLLRDMCHKDSITESSYIETELKYGSDHLKGQPVYMSENVSL